MQSKAGGNISGNTGQRIRRSSSSTRKTFTNANLQKTLKMKFQKGKSGNPAGRPPGIKNKSTDQLRDTVREFIEYNIDTLQIDFDKLTEPIQRLQFIDRLLKHVLPAPLDEFQRLSSEDVQRIADELRQKYSYENKQ